MDKKLIAVVAGASILGIVVVGETDKRSLHWMASSEHTHSELPEGTTHNFGSRVRVDSGSTATAAMTGWLNNFPSAFLNVK